MMVVLMEGMKEGWWIDGWMTDRSMEGEKEGVKINVWNEGWIDTLMKSGKEEGKQGG